LVLNPYSEKAWDTTKIIHPNLQKQFAEVDAPTGTIATYKDDTGQITINTIYNNDGVFVAFHDCHIEEYHGDTKGNDVNGLLLNVYMLGSSTRISDSFSGERLVGYGNVARLWTSESYLKPHTKYIRSLAIVVLLNDFELTHHGDRWDEIVTGLMERYCQLHNKSFQFKLNALLMSYCYALDEMAHKNSIDTRQIKEIVSYIFLELYSNDPEKIIIGASERYDIADRICEDMLSCIRTECDLETIFERYGVNKYKANRLFKERYGMPPYNFYRMHKLYRAAGLILLGENNMTKVAEMTGYESPSKFAIVFRKIFGVRPKHFRGFVMERYQKMFSDMD
jgi:AraC-like DNA-binding protein